MRTTENEIYVNAPLPIEVADALRARARENGRCVGRELAQIAARTLARSVAAAAVSGKTGDGDQGTGRPTNGDQGTGRPTNGDQGTGRPTNQPINQ